MEQTLFENKYFVVFVVNNELHCIAKQLTI